MNTRRLLYVLGGLFLLAYFVSFTWKGLLFDLDNDDMYSIYLGWSKRPSELLLPLVEFWNSAFRPLGLLFYRGLFETFGFHPLPFRVSCFALTVSNIAICFRFLHIVSDSERIAAIGVLLFAFQSRLMEVWWRTAIVYDILCFTFVYAALCLYVDARKQGRMPGPGRSIAIVLCYLCAIDSKEMAVVVPVFLVAYEALFGRWKFNWIILLSALMAALFIVSKTHGGASSMADPSFTPTYTLQRFEQNWNGALTHLFLRKEDLQGPLCIGILGALLALAAVMRNRLLLFAWAILFFGAMPVIFIPPRGGYVLYISYVGWTLYAAVVLVMLQDLILRWMPGQRTQLAVFTFLLVAWRYGKFNLHDQRLDPVKPWLYDSPRAVRTFADDMLSQHASLPKGARILLLRDGFQIDEWTPVFIGRLLYEDRSLTIDRIKMMDHKPVNWSGYQFVYDYAHGVYKPVDRQ